MFVISLYSPTPILCVILALFSAADGAKVNRGFIDHVGPLTPRKLRDFLPFGLRERDVHGLHLGKKRLISIEAGATRIDTPSHFTQHVEVFEVTSRGCSGLHHDSSCRPSATQR
jgi:hypothetical protein